MAKLSCVFLQSTLGSCIAREVSWLLKLCFKTLFYLHMYCSLTLDIYRNFSVTILYEYLCASNYSRLVILPVSLVCKKQVIVVIHKLYLFPLSLLEI